MSREVAARYIGVGTTKFDELVLDKRMPKPRQIDGRIVWDRVELDFAFSDLPRQDQAEKNFFDGLRAPPDEAIIGGGQSTFGSGKAAVALMRFLYRSPPDPVLFILQSP